MLPHVSATVIVLLKEWKDGVTPHLLQPLICINIGVHEVTVANLEVLPEFRCDLCVQR